MLVIFVGAYILENTFLPGEVGGGKIKAKRKEVRGKVKVKWTAKG
jgi:hypothetical protein